MGWITDSLIDHTINISKHKSLCGSNYIKLPEELRRPRKGLINIHNIDNNECLKCFLVRYLHPPDHHSARIRKFDKDFARKCDFKDIKFHVKIRNIHKVEKTTFYQH